VDKKFAESDLKDIARHYYRPIGLQLGYTVMYERHKAMPTRSDG